MKIAFPLSLKVTLWLLLNLVLLGAVAATFFLLQVGLGWESFFSGPASDRVQAIGDVIAAELSQNPTRDRDEVLARFSQAYGVELRLFRSDGTLLAGRRITLPPEVQLRVQFSREGGEFRPLSEPSSTRFAGERGPPEDLPPIGPPPARFEAERGPPEGFPPAGPPHFGMRERFFLRTNHPTRYWIGIRLPLPAAGKVRPTLMTLVAATDSIGGAGLLFDVKPWLIAALAVSGLSILFWLPLVGSITRALGRLTAATRQIAEGHFNTRVQTRRSDELGRLGESINTMAERLDGFVSGQRRFLGDIAHELASPVARLQFATDILEERAGPALQNAVADVREEVQHMSTLVNELLAFTKAGLSPRDVVLVAVDLAPLVERVLAREGAAGRVAATVPPGLHVMAEPELLARAFGNIVRNALRYAGGGPITILARHDSAEIVVTIADEGPGVSPEALARLGEPFYRPEAARTRETGGVGLGLAIVKKIIKDHNGSIRASNRDRGGAEFVIHLPVPG